MQNILLIDDDPSVAMTVDFVLKRWGGEVHFEAVDSGAKGLDKLRDGFKGLILLDVMMPEMDGWETVEAMVNGGLLDGNVICMLTAVGDPGVRMESLTQYILDYVRKPCDPDEIVQAVQQGLALCC